MSVPSHRNTALFTLSTAKRGRLARPAAISLTTVLLAAAAIAPATRVLAATWSVVTTPNATSQRNVLNGADAQGSTAAWAVGSADTGTTPATRPLLARWNGTAWSLADSPVLASAATLNAVDGSAAGNVWAVGAVGSRTLTERWNGSGWTVVPSATPVEAVDAVLRGVKTLATNDAWAVGDASVPPGTFQRRSLITHWDGTSWTIVPSPSPDPTQNLLVAVDGTASDLWAVGNLGHDGYGGDTVAGMMLHWDGSSWTQAVLPSGGSTFSIIKLRDVISFASNNVWVVGEAFHRQMLKAVPYVLRWNGTTWQHGTIPDPPDGSFSGIAALSSTNLYAVGQKNGSRTLVARWSGSVWSQEVTPSAGVNSRLNDVFAAGVGIGAVGSQFGSDWIGRTLAVHTANG